MEGSAPDFKPLYQQVRDLLIGRIVAGAWRPGEALPSEFQLADEFRVSQGTVRKALDEMAARNLLVRQQGKGTFVATHTPQRALFHFFHLVADDGARALARASAALAARRQGDEDRSRAPGPARPRRHHPHPPPAPAGRPRRDRREHRAAGRLFPGLDKRAEALPNELYRFYEQTYRVAVARAVEKIKAVAARPDEARFLGLKSGAPLLEIDRVAHALDGRAVEWRVSRCDTADHHYVSELT